LVKSKPIPMNCPEQVCAPSNLICITLSVRQELPPKIHIEDSGGYSVEAVTDWCEDHASTAFLAGMAFVGVVALGCLLWSG